MAHMLVGTHIGTGLEHIEKPLNLVVALMEIVVNALARTLSRCICKMIKKTLIETL